MANIIQVKDGNGVVFYPQTHEKAVIDNNGVTLSSKLAGALSNEYVPVTTLPTASASTVGKKYVVPVSGSTAKEVWVTSQDGSTYTWVSLGTMDGIDLEGYVTDEEFSQLSQEVDALFPETVEDGFFIVDENLNVGAVIDEDGIHAKNIVEFETVE